MLNLTKIAFAISALLLFTSCSSSSEEASASSQIDEAGYALVATFTVKDGEVDRFIEAMKENTVESRKEEGVVDYRSYQSPDNPNVFINFEAYTDEAAFDAHLETDHVKKVGPIFDEILDGEIEVEFLDNY